ncbi:MAG: alpha/beta hydrolase [Actinomycetes bacterium]
MDSASAAIKAQGAVVRGLMRLGPAAQLRIAGGTPTVRDGQTLDPGLQLLLKLMAMAPQPQMERLSPVQARAGVTETRSLISAPQLPMASVTETTVAGAEGPLRARLYVPEECKDSASPLLVFYHGGGFVICDLETHDAPCRLIAQHSGCRVLSVDYRLAPEHKYPAAADDALAAFRDVVARADEFGADPERIAVGGDSAGGQLATVTAQQALADGGAAPAFQLLIYPVCDFAEKYPSYHLFSEGFFLTEAQMDWFGQHYLSVDDDLNDPKASPLKAGPLAGLAPAHIITAGFDPLRDEGEAYAAKLKSDGVDVTLRRHPSLIHGFINFAVANRTSHDGVCEMAGVLRAALAA